MSTAYGAQFDRGIQLANIELIVWLKGHLAESERLHAEFEEQAKQADYDDYELEISRHTEDGFKSALQFVISHLKEQNNG